LWSFVIFFTNSECFDQEKSGKPARMAVIRILLQAGFLIVLFIKGIANKRAVKGLSIRKNSQINFARYFFAEAAKKFL
jgi:hypothetical protein